MKILKGLLIVLVVLAGLVYAGSFMMPADYGLSRSVVINAPAAQIFEQVNNLEKWPAWSPWAAIDPEMKVTYTDTKSGVGAMYSWVGPQTGVGSLTITASEPNNSLDSDLNFDGSIAKSGWKFEEQEGGTKVTWDFRATAGGAIERYMGIMIETFLAPSYEDGLNRLKTVVEALPKEEPMMEEPAIEGDSVMTTEEESGE